MRFTLSEILAMKGVDQVALKRQLGIVPTRKDPKVAKKVVAVPTPRNVVSSGTKVGLAGPWTITVEDWHPPTVNSLMRGHWAKRGRVKKSATYRVTLECKKFAVPVADRKRKVEITVYCPNMSRQPDPDNTLKAVLDGLSHAGAIVDDKSQWCEWTTPVVLKGKKCTVIRISDL